MDPNAVPANPQSPQIPTYPTYPTYGSIQPWIQTTGGDVHSNTNINTPGGP